MPTAIIYLVVNADGSKDRAVKLKPYRNVRLFFFVAEYNKVGFVDGLENYEILIFVISSIVGKLYGRSFF